MTGDVNFNGKVAKKINLSDISVSGLSADKKAKLDAIFNKVNTEADENILTADELVVLSDIDKNHDGTITEAEMIQSYNSLSADEKQDITQTEYITYLKAMAAKNAEVVADEAEVGNGYVVQLGESFSDLVTRVLKSRGLANDSTNRQACQEAILNANRNNGAIQFDTGGHFKWLVAGKTLIIPTMTEGDRTNVQVKNQKNEEQVIKKYNDWKDGRGPLKSFQYKIDENGRTYEVRGGTETEFDATKEYGSSGYYSSPTAPGGNPADPANPANPADPPEEIYTPPAIDDAYNLGLINDGTIDNEDLSAADAKQTFTNAIDILKKLGDVANLPKDDDGNIEDGAVVKDDSAHTVTITFEDETKVVVQLDDEEEKIESVMVYNEDGSDVVIIENDGKVIISHDGESSQEINLGMNFDSIEKLLLENPEYRKVMELPDVDKIINQDSLDAVLEANTELTAENRTAIKAELDKAQETLAKLERAYEVKEVSEPVPTDEDNQSEVTITMQDGSKIVVTIEGGSDEILKVNVVSRTGDVDVTYDVAEGKISLKKPGGDDVIDLGAVMDESDQLIALVRKGMAAKEATGAPTAIDDAFREDKITQHKVHEDTTVDANKERFRDAVDVLKHIANPALLDGDPVYEDSTKTTTFTLTDGTKVEVKADDDGNITQIICKDADDNVLASFKNDNTVTIENVPDKNSTSSDVHSSEDIPGVVKDFAVLEKFVKSNPKFREANGLSPFIEVDEDAILDEEATEAGVTKAEVIDTIKTANEVLQNFENASAVKDNFPKLVDPSGDYQKVKVAMKDGSIATVYIKNNDFAKAVVKTAGTEVTYDFEHHSVKVKMGSDSDSPTVTSDGAIADENVVLEFIKKQIPDPADLSAFDRS
ncbi:MAG: hypothetical protein K6E29_05350 [Cyanobacteria bacterium RUI128]|nr:hypothetical protein [Cyanobacteria bacterium RUI128]